jgi:hypothetical protein
LELDPDFAIDYYNLAVNHVYLNRIGEGEDWLRRAAAPGLDIDEFVMLEYEIAFLKADGPAMEEIVSRARARPGAQN